MQNKLEKKIAELKNGDGRAFDYIYDKTNRSVYFAVFYLLGDRMSAEDIMHDAYIKAMESIHMYRAGTNFTAWLCTIAKNLALNHIKRRSREIPTDFDEEPYKYGTKHPDTPYVFDVAARVLKEDEYEIMMLCQVAGYKRREVAEMLGLPIGTVTWKNNEALKKLKKYLSEEGGR